jgi:hypothetical protein
MGREELPHLKVLLRLGILMVVGEIGLFEAVQTSRAGIAVENGFFGDKPVAAVNAEKNLLIDFSPAAPGDLPWNDWVGHCALF